MRNIYSRLIIILTLSLLFVGLLPNHANAVDLNDFSFSSFNADYYLSKDSEGRSTMRVVEKLTAEFINKDQNRGIERAIPTNYDGHTVSFKFESMMRNGVVEQIYEQRNESGFAIISTRRNDPVNGTQEYTFTYTLRDVTKTFGNRQELYWDTNGTGWAQSFDNVTVRVHLDESIKSAFTGEISCYKGAAGSTNQCKGTVYGNTVSFSSDGLLKAGENLTFDLSFNKGTFVGYQLTPLDIIPYILVGIATILLIVAIVFKVRYGKDNPGRGTIIAEYLPPKNISVLFAAEIAGKVTTSSTAQIIDLAVRHKVKIIESKEKFLFTNITKYTLELISIDGLNEEELSFVSILFGSNSVGSKYTFDKNDQTRSMMLLKLNELIKKQTETKGYRLIQTKIRTIQTSILLGLIALVVIAGAIFINTSNDIGIFIVITVAIIFILLIVVFQLFIIRPLTAMGRELYDYLKGLEVYIKLAEADRLRVLQSPEGAEKVVVDTSDLSKIIILYERVLPYAVLFGQEKEWFKQLGNYYENSQTVPSWYFGVSAFNAASFASSVSGFSSYASSSSFSSNSGAGGGGSSGGGGGGGGGGGV